MIPGKENLPDLGRMVYGPKQKESMEQRFPVPQLFIPVPMTSYHHPIISTHQTPLMHLRSFALVFISLPFLVSCEKDNVVNDDNINLEDGLIAFFPFNGNTNDESVNNNHGTLLNGALLSYD